MGGWFCWYLVWLVWWLAVVVGFASIRVLSGWLVLVVDHRVSVGFGYLLACADFGFLV